MISEALAERLRVRPDAVARPTAVSFEADVLVHETVSESYRRLVLAAPTIAERATPGQFVMITVPGPERILLPRPMAIHRRRPEAGTIEVIYGVIGRGTEALARVAPGDALLVTGPLGKGYDVPDDDRSVLLLGRGIGVCAVMTVAEDAQRAGRRVTAVLSASTPARVIGESDCAELNVTAWSVVDTDGSSSVDSLRIGLHERFADAPPGAILVCGSSRLTALASELGSAWGSDVQVSLEAHMACGLGYCHGCAAPTPTDPSREGPLVCVDGPVFDVVGSSH